MQYIEWLNFWFENCVKLSVKERTYLGYKNIAGNHIIPSLGKYEIDELTHAVLQKFVSNLLKHFNNYL